VQPRRRTKQALPHVAVILGCFVVTIVVTFPLIARLSTHLSGIAAYHDAVCFAWNNWWVRHALVDMHGHKPYFTEHLLVPFPLDLRLHTLGLLYALASVPVLSFLGPITVVNLQILVTPVLNGYATFLLTRRWVGRNDAAALAGLAVAASPAINFHLGMGRPSCAALWPVALGLLFLVRLIERPSWQNRLGLAAALLALLLVDQQMLIFGAIVFFLYLLWVGCTRPRDIFNRRILASMLVLVAIVAYPIRVLYVRPFLQTSGYTAPHPSEALNYSAWPSMLVSPVELWDRYGSPLLVGLVAAVALARRERRGRFGILVALACLCLTFGPVAHGTRIPLPFAALQRAPGFGQFRAPYRFQIPAALGMALALAAALTALLRRLEEREAHSRTAGRRLLGAALLLILGDAGAHRAVRGFATHEIADEPIYHRIAATAGDFLVLEVPFGVRSGTDVVGRGDDLMLYQTVHAKRMLNGYLTRIPLAALDYYRRSPALLFLGNEPYALADLAADFESKLADLNVGFIVVHPDILEPDRLRAVLAFLRERRDLVPVATGTALFAFRRDVAAAHSGASPAP
jgi:hypothetical protein